MDLEQTKLVSQLLDTSLTEEQQSQLRNLARKPKKRGPVHVDLSVVKFLRDKEMDAVLRAIETYKERLSSVPEGFQYKISADGEFGNYLESGHASLNVELRLPNDKGKSVRVEWGNVRAWQKDSPTKIYEYLSSRFEKLIRLAKFL